MLIRLRRGGFLFLVILVSLAGCLSRVTESPAPVIPETPTSAELKTLAPVPDLRIAETPTASPTPGSTPTPEPSQTPTPGYPSSHYLSISGHKQSYALSCEASAAVDWAAYFGVNIYESDFQFALPLSDNPDIGFCGQVLTDRWGQIPPYAYGVHAKPVADLLVEYGLPARVIDGWTLEQVKQKIAENKPILIWVIGNMEYSEPVIYVDKEGREVLVAPFEHAVILTGYDETTVRYMNNGRFYDVPAKVFLTSWGVLNNMGIVHE